MAYPGTQGMERLREAPTLSNIRREPSQGGEHPGPKRQTKRCVKKEFKRQGPCLTVTHNRFFPEFQRENQGPSEASLNPGTTKTCEPEAPKLESAFRENGHLPRSECTKRRANPETEKRCL